MNEKEFVIIANALKSVYTQNNFLADNNAMDIWFSLLKDLDYKAVQAAVQTHIMTDSFPPTIASIRKAVANLTEPKEINEMQAWALVSDALRDSTYHATERFNALPESVQKAVGSPEILRAWALSENFNENVAQSHFISTYRVILQRKTKELSLPPSMRIETANNNIGGYLSGN